MTNRKVFGIEDAARIGEPRNRKVAGRVIGEVITNVYVLFGQPHELLGVFRSFEGAEYAARSSFILPNDHYSILTRKLEG